jgi:hypothetical protein
MSTNEPTQAEIARRRAAQTARVFRQQVIALSVLGLVVLVLSAWRGGWHNIFPSGWWRW